MHRIESWTKIALLTLLGLLTVGLGTGTAGEVTVLSDTGAWMATDVQVHPGPFRAGDGATLVPGPHQEAICGQRSTKLENGDDDDQLPAPCTGCNFGSSFIQGASHNLNGGSDVVFHTPGECATYEDGTCGTEEQCSGAIDVSVVIYNGELVIDNATGRCVPNSSGRPILRTWRYNYTGDCGSYGTVRFDFHDTRGAFGCNNPGPLLDSATAVLYCNFCT